MRRKILVVVLACLAIGLLVALPQIRSGAPMVDALGPAQKEADSMPQAGQVAPTADSDAADDPPVEAVTVEDMPLKK